MTVALCENPTPRQDSTAGAKAIERFRQAHRRRELIATLEDQPPTCTPRQLLNAARDRGLDPTLGQCQALLTELRPKHPLDMPKNASTGIRAVILKAARAFSRAFTKQELVVAAWKLAPNLCSLEGFPEYPDCNKILGYLYGRRGMIARGEVARTQGGRFLVPD